MFARILELLFPSREDERIIRELGDDAFLPLIEPELVALGGESAVALLRFADERVRAAVHEAKYRGSEHALRLLAAPLAEYLRDLATDGELKDPVLIPIPLGKARRRERGFNQAEEVAKLVAKDLQMPLASDILERTRETGSQVSLPRWRREQNMRGAFACPPAGRGSINPSASYILLDDVCTTGATLAAATAALRAGGAAHVLPIALAH